MMSCRRVIRWIFGVLGLMLVAPGPVRAQEPVGVAYLKIGITARELAMGSTGVAFSRGAAAAGWNPAGLLHGGSMEIRAGYHQWVQGVRIYSASFRRRAGMLGAWALDARAVTDTRARESAQPAVAALGVGFARRLGVVDVGLLVRGVYERVLTESIYGYAVDMGVRTGLRGVDIGIAIQHLGTLVRPVGVLSPGLPVMVRAGIGMYPFRMVTLVDDASVLELAVSVEGVHLPDEGEALWGRGTDVLHLGAALEVLQTVEVRAGYRTPDAVRPLAFGLGVMLDVWQFDYAYLPFHIGVEGTAAHVFTLTVRWH